SAPATSEGRGGRPGPSTGRGLRPSAGGAAGPAVCGILGAVNTVLPDRDETPALPVSGTAVLIGVLVAYAAFAVLISIVAAFANGAHANQQLSGAAWKQLGTGGGIVT